MWTPPAGDCEGVDFLTGSTAAEVPGEAAGVGCPGEADSPGH